MDELRTLARFASGFRLDEAPADVVDRARYCVLDSLGSALGSARSEGIPAIVEELGRWSGGDSPRSAALWGQSRRMDVFSAVLVNGMLAHALELDDVHTGSKSHVGAVVVPAAWTMADALDLSGRAFLEAVIVGYEAMARVGMAMDVASNRKRGWHTTGIIGTFGAAAAAAHALGLDEERTLSAFGMAGTQSSGLWAFLAEGSTCKKLHTARAAANGLAAAILAKAGMTGPARILDAADGGLFAAVSDRFDMAKVCADLGERYEILNIDKKPYPCCRSTHHAIDAAIALRGMDGFEPGRVEGITVRTYDVAVLQCGTPEYPKSAVEAKFSIAFTCAAALVRGKVTLAEFQSQAIDDPVIKDLAGRVRVVEDPAFTERYPGRWGCEVVIAMKGGGELVKRIDDMSGSVRVPLSAKQEEGKFLSLASFAFDDPERVENCLSGILRIDALDGLPNLA